VIDKTKIHEALRHAEQRLKAYILTLRDVRNVGSLVFVVLVLLVSWSGVKAIQTNYRLQQEVTKLEQQNAVARLKNTNQVLQNDYFKTSQYREITARQNFGLAAPGETVWLVPKEVALAHVVPEPEVTEAKQKAKHKLFWQENFEAWIDFFFHRVHE